MQSPVRVWRKQKKEREYLGQGGRIVSWTEILIAPPKFSQDTPYTVVLVRLKSGENAYGQLVDFEGKDRMIGKKVVAVLRRNGVVGKEEIIEYAVKFKPV